MKKEASSSTPIWTSAWVVGLMTCPCAYLRGGEENWEDMAGPGGVGVVENGYTQQLAGQSNEVAVGHMDLA